MITLSNGKTFSPSASLLIGAGGEAEIYKMPGNPKEVFKLFKGPKHADFQFSTDLQQAAESRLLEHQTKLKDFPKVNIPTLITPTCLGTNKQNQIVGYSMPFINGSEPLIRFTDIGFRNAQNVDGLIHSAMKSLHTTVSQIHSQKIVIGDFNDVNVLVFGDKAFCIDADSMQFGKYYCKMFTERFVDPLHCDPKSIILHLTHPHDENTDWYAFTLMFMQILLMVGPYGGIHKPKTGKGMKYGERVLTRTTVFNPDVIYPRPAVPISLIPDDLLNHFYLVFEKDLRVPFPTKLLNVQWTVCSGCGTKHARAKCPNCTTAHPTLTQVVEIKGSVKATTIFTSSKFIVSASAYGSTKWLSYESSGFLEREDKTQVVEKIQLDLNPKSRIRLMKNQTLIGTNNTLHRFKDTVHHKEIVDTFRGIPQIDGVNKDLYFIRGGILYHVNEDGKQRSIGTVLENQTQFWIGSSFGFGFYQAGEIKVGFVFDLETGGLNDKVDIPRITGQLLSMHCVFSSTHVWSFYTIQEKGRLLHRCVLTTKNGMTTDFRESSDPDTWIQYAKNGCAVSSHLFVPTDNGIVRVDDLEISRTYADTDPWVDSSTKLLLAQDGIYAVSVNKIVRITLN